MIEGRTYKKGTRMRTVVGFDGYMVGYKTHSSRPRICGEAIWIARKWFDKAEEVPTPNE